MSHLNYFEPYNKKKINHEDQLTRAFLVVLRFSPTTLLMFNDLVFNSCIKIASLKKSNVDLPRISEVELDNIIFETQTSDLKNISANKILSVLITDEAFEPTQKIKNCSRGARYDGIIAFSDSLLFLIENKPKSYNVWEEQLSPNLKNKSREVELIEVPAIIEWKQLIKQLNTIININSIGGCEKLIIMDFLDYVDENFSFLNPYDNLSQCKNDFNLLTRRLKNILLDIVKIKDSVRYQVKWKNNIIEIGFPEIRMIIFSFHFVDEDNYNLIISLYFGDTQNQSKNFYQNNINYETILKLQNKGWQFRPDFHISFMQTHLVWFATQSQGIKKYYEYWMKNSKHIKQQPKELLLKYLDNLKNVGIIEINSKELSEIHEKVLNTNRNTINICPAFVLYYSIKSDFALKLDKQNQLNIEIRKKIKEGLSILQRPVTFLK